MSRTVRASLLAILAVISVVPVVAAVDPPSSVAFDRLSGVDRYATAVAISKRVAPNGDVPVVYLVSGATFADALAAGPLAAIEGGVVLLTPTSVLPAVVKTELVRLSPAAIVVAGGPTVIAPNVANEAASATGATLTRVFGPDRFATAAALSRRAFPNGADVAFVVSGLSFPDALAAGPAAAKLGGPVLLTRSTSLPQATAAELRRLDPDQVVVVGGTAVVSGPVATAIGNLGPSVSRVAGLDRYGTAAAVGARFFPGSRTALVATGQAFPDALAGTPLAASIDAPIILTFPAEVPIATRDAMISARPSKLIALGGSSAVSKPVLLELAAWSRDLVKVQPPGPDYRTFDSRYHNYPEMVTRILVAEASYPNLVDVFSIGKSYGGRQIWAAKVSDNVKTDEAEPEVLFDALHHAREHLTVEQALDTLRLLTDQYESNSEVHRLVDSREIFIVFALNPDGWAYDLGGSPYRGWRKNRQPTPGSSSVGTDINRNYGYHWACCGGSSSNPAAWNYHGPAAWSTPEARALRDFVMSRVIGGKQQIKTHVTLHTNGELILYPYGYTRTNIPKDMRPDDHAVFVRMARSMAAKNGYTAKQSSDLYITDGDQIDWMYGRQGIFSFTFELYPTEQVSSHADHEPPDEVIGKQTARNRSALLYLIDAADCPWKVIGKASTYCPTT